MSFGPKEYFDKLLILNSIDQENIKIYKINYSFDSEKFQSMKILKKHTFNDQSKHGRRPRINPNKILDYFDDKEIIYEGSITNLLE